MGADSGGTVDVDVAVTASADVQGRHGILRAPVSEADHLPVLRHLQCLPDHHGMDGGGSHALLLKLLALHADQRERIDGPGLKSVSLLDEHGQVIIPVALLAGSVLEAGRMARVGSRSGATVPVRPPRKEVRRVQD